MRLFRARSDCEGPVLLPRIREGTSGQTKMGHGRRSADTSFRVWLATAAAAWLALAGLHAARADDTALPKERPDIEDSPDPVQGDWIRKADVMYIGDSESLGHFGDDLYRALTIERDPKTGRALRVWTYWVCGADVISWNRGGVSYCGIRTCNGAGQCARDHGPNGRPATVHYSPVGKYMDVVQPSVTIVSLGTNVLTTHDFRVPEFYAFYLVTVGHLVDRIRSGGSQCIWIGPPQASLKTKTLAEYAKFVDDLGRTVRDKGCTFIDSDPLSDRSYVLKRDPEGTHYQSDGERAWRVKVWQQLQPILQTKLKT
jgi:hypothetical protein